MSVMFQFVAHKAITQEKINIVLNSLRYVECCFQTGTLKLSYEIKGQQ